MTFSLRKTLFGTLFFLLAAVTIAGWLIAQPGCRRSDPPSQTADPALLRQHVEWLSTTMFPRDWTQVDTLRQCADGIETRLQAPVVRQEAFTIRSGMTYANVIASFAPDTSPRIVVGAHYDAYTDYPGADDNASGVAGLIELSRLLSQLDNPPPVDLVAYPLEEPIFFGTDQMGSSFHARYLEENDIAVRGVIILEMIGYFSDEPGSQSYPLPILRAFYPGKGNFIALASRWDQGDWIREVKAGMQGATDLSVRSIRAPAGLPGIDFSDHRNYWPYNIPALMVTDTAFYRNERYHTPEDTPDTLDYTRMAQVVTAVFQALQTLQDTP